MEESPRAAAEYRPTPMAAASAAWGALAVGFSYLFMVPRPGRSLGAWDSALQVVALFLLFAIVPFSAVHGLDLYRAHVDDSPDEEPRHRAGFLLHAAAGVFATLAWVAFALTLG